jgi:hypothetical protein
MIRSRAKISKAAISEISATSVTHPTREELLSQLRASLDTNPPLDLMNKLQDLGLVADTAVHLSDVPDSDLKRAARKLNHQS